MRNFKIFVFIVLLFVVFCGSAMAQTASLSIYVANPTAGAAYADAMGNYPDEPISWDDAKTTRAQFTATTTPAITSITSLAGRKSMSIYITSGSGELWVGLGTTTAALSKGIKVTSSLENVAVSANCPVSFISTGTIDVVYVEFARREKARNTR